MFNLEHALAAWRKALQYRRAVSADDLEELERHVRDHTAARRRQGWGEEAAFREALQHLGTFAQLETEYQKVFWDKVRHQRTWRHQLNGILAMLKNYWKVTARTLWRHQGYAVINIGGLAVGLAVCLVIGLFVAHKLSYDRFLPNADHVYRLEQTLEGRPMAVPPPGLTYLVEQQFPEIRGATVFQRSDQRLFTVGEDRQYVEGVLQADSAFFRVFPYPLLHGDAATALAAPGQIVLAASLAQRYFGDENPLGQVLQLDTRNEYVVTGVMPDVPSNAHFQFQAVTSFSARARAMRYGGEVLWPYFGYYAYLELHPGTDLPALTSRIQQYATSLNPPDFVKERLKMYLRPATRIHLYSDAQNEIGVQGDIRYLYLFGGIALLILLIACTNYTNLATARAARRSREVGVRKALGAWRGQLMTQFFSESLLLVLLAVPLALGLAVWALPLVEHLTQAEIDPQAVGYGWLALLATGFVLTVGLLSGSYPALFLSAFRPVQVLRGTWAPGRQRDALRKTLVTLQFAITTVLLVGTAAVYLQLRYVQSQSLGFEQAQVVTITNRALGPHYEAFKTALLQQPRIQSVSAGPPPGIAHMTSRTKLAEKDGRPETELEFMEVAYDYAETVGLHLLAGRTFSAAFGTDTSAVMLSASAAAALGIAPEQVGEATVPLFDTEKRVIGIFADIHNHALREAVRPLALGLKRDRFYTALIRLQPGAKQVGLADIEQAWQPLFPEHLLDARFLDTRIEQQYVSEQRLAQVFSVFAGLAVLLACLGLFGLAAFLAAQRTKEIGIRKVLGATSAGLLWLLSKDFVRLVLLGFLLGAPLAYLGLQRWLATYAYHPDLGVGLIALAGATALVFALAAVGYQVLRAARQDPAESLRYE